MNTRSNFELFEFNELTSTSDYLKAHHQNHKKHDVIWAHVQTSGRGQYDRIWSSNTGGLFFSVLLEPDFLNIEVEDLILLFSNYLKSFLLENYQVEVTIKPPNDVYYQGKKLCGVLIENSFLGNNLEYCILGVGINLNQTFVNQRDLNAVSLYEIIQKEVSIKSFLLDLLETWEPEF